MTISPLPEATVRQLGATLAITSPVTLVKELLDNALDSGASSVTITVSPNTVDKIEVRDNGHGISHGDFGALARCGHTSKIKTLHDLNGIGGDTLGFRGVALASATTLAEIRMTTRIPEEPVAATLLLHEQGGATLQERKAAPIGTTVSATRLFHKFPVRLRTAKQEASRTIQTIKRLLQSYALARPHVKMTFKILGEPDTAWQYTPGPKPTPKDAVLRVFGVGLSSVCNLYQLSDIETGPCVDTMSDCSSATATIARGLAFEAVLPRPDADTQKMGKGAFLSVDSRPISATRGTGKRLLSLFRTALGRRRCQLGLGDAPRDPFIQLNIRCPPGSYDVNVEPAKDDVLFSREDYLVQQFERFIASVYSASPCEDDELPGAYPQEAPPASPEAGSEIQAPAWRVDMSQGLDIASDDDIDDVRPSNVLGIPNHAAERHQPDSPVDTGAGPSSAGLNPWSIAMMAAPRRSNEAREVPRHIGRTPLPSARPSNITEELPRARARAHEGPRAMPHEAPRVRTNESRFPGRESEPSRQEFPYDYPESIAEDTRRQEAAPLAPRRSAPLANRSSAARGGRSQVSGGAYKRPTQIGVSSSFSNDQRRPLVRAHAFVPQRPSSLGSNLRSLPNFNEQERNRHGQPHPERTRRDTHPISHVHLRPASSDASAINRRGAIERYLQSVEQMPDVAAILHPNRNVRPPSPPCDIPTGEDNEVIEVPPEETSRTSLAAEDTRAYLIRRQRSIVAEPQKKLRRMRTDLLPFERIPQEFQTKELALKMKVSPEKVSKQVFFGATQPDPLHSGDSTQKQNLLDDDMALQVVERRTAALLARRGAQGTTVALKPVLSASEV
ncbi:hypothetical protein QBC39DRAFT_156311 [Podospora conica]|nr:hypothetical protein QBC39DRAFT_156311 [Schizothecium conicum]